MMKGHGLLQVADQTDIGDGFVRTSYHLRMLGI